MLIPIPHGSALTQSRNGRVRSTEDDLMFPVEKVARVSVGHIVGQEWVRKREGERRYPGYKVDFSNPGYASKIVELHSQTPPLCPLRPF